MKKTYKEINQSLANEKKMSKRYQKRSEYYEEELEELKQNNAALIEKIKSDHETLFKELQNQYSLQKLVASELSEELKILTSERTAQRLDFQATLDSTLIENAQLRQKLSEEYKAHVSNDAKIRDIQKSLSKAQAKITSMNERLLNLQADKFYLSTEKVRLEKALAAQTERHEDSKLLHRNEIENALRELLKLESDLKTLLQKNTDLQTEKDVILAEHCAIKKTLKNSSDDMESLRTEHENFAVSKNIIINQLLSDLSSQEDIMCNLKRKNAEVIEHNLEIEDFNRELETKLAVSEAALQNKSFCLIKATDKLNQQFDEIKITKKENTRIKNDVLGYQSEIASLTERQSNLTGDLNRAINDSKRLDELESEIQLLKSQANRSKELVQNLELDWEKSQTSLEKSKSEIDSLRKEKTFAEDKILNTELEIESLRIHLQNAQAEKEELLQTIAEERQQAVSCTDTLRSITDNSETFHNQGQVRLLFHVFKTK